MNTEDMREVLARIDVPEYTFEIVEKPGGVLLLRGRYKEGDIGTGDITDQFTRKWYLSPYAVKSELVQTAFLCYLTSMEHRAREHFRYRRLPGGTPKRVFGPHYDVDALHSICNDDHLDYRRDAVRATHDSQCVECGEFFQTTNVKAIACPECVEKYAITDEEQTMRLQSGDALIVVDMQNDFIIGSLAVKEAEEIIPVVNRLLDKFHAARLPVFFSACAHPRALKRMSSASGAAPFSQGPDGTTLWPENSWGAQLHASLHMMHWQDNLIVKGYRETEDAFSAFKGTAKDPARNGATLDELLRDGGVNRNFVCGLATDFCVGATCRDSVDLGYKTVLVTDAIKGVFTESTNVTLDNLFITFGAQARTERWVMTP